MGSAFCDTGVHARIVSAAQTMGCVRVLLRAGANASMDLGMERHMLYVLAFGNTCGQGYWLLES